eukprot:scaffold149638_cov54-Prasinocladus_malaysianus.AAC.1
MRIKCPARTPPLQILGALPSLSILQRSTQPGAGSAGPRLDVRQGQLADGTERLSVVEKFEGILARPGGKYFLMSSKR